MEDRCVRGTSSRIVACIYLHDNGAHGIALGCDRILGEPR